MEEGPIGPPGTRPPKAPVGLQGTGPYRAGPTIGLQGSGPGRALLAWTLGTRALQDPSLSDQPLNAGGLAGNISGFSSGVAQTLRLIT
jgi:hypothetical protein